MDKSAGHAFVYAKASGLLGKSFIGDRTNLLFEVKSLSELWTLLFKTQAPLIPEVLLAQKIEEEAFNKFISEYSYFINQFEHPDSFLSDQFFVYEVENLKEVCDSLCAGETEIPQLLDIGKYSTLHYDKWPEIQKITEGTEYSWLKELPTIHGQQLVEFHLDIQAVKHLWSSVHKIGGEIGEVVIQMFTEEYVIKNIVWAIRLRVNYGMSREEIIPKLMYVTDKPSLRDPIARPAIDILDKNPEVYADWENWRYKDYVNPNNGGIWCIDPAWIERKALLEQNRDALRLFHCYPMTSAALIGWYKAKQFELSCIRTAVESIRLNTSPESIFDFTR